MTSAPLDHAVQELLDRQQILDCMARYVRGVDRMDAELLLSAYHEDATDTRAGVTRSPREFVEYLWPTQDDRDGCLHHNTSISIELEGDVAHVESYYLALIRLKERDRALVAAAGHGPVHAGRYVDRFERRAAGWRLAKRVVLSEMRFWMDPDEMPALSDVIARGPADLSYRRPL